MALNKDKVMASAQKLIQQGKLDKAIKELQRLLEEDPKDVRTLLKIGDLFTKKGDRNDATQTYLKVAEFYSEQGFYLKAVAVYKQILRVDPNLVDVNLRLAELYHQLGLMNDSVASYQLVAAALDRQGRTKESLAIIKKMVDLDPENVASRIKLAEMYSSQSMVPEAVKEFETACQQLRKADRLDDFIKVAERLLFHDATRTDVARDLAQLYLQRGDPKRGLAKLQVCFKANSKDVDTLVLLAQAFSDLEQPSKTVSVLRELAKVYVEKGQTDQADATWRRVLAMAPDDEDAKRALGMMPATQRAPSGFEDDALPSFVGAFPTGNSLVASRPAVLGNASGEMSIPRVSTSAVRALDGGAVIPVTGPVSQGIGHLEPTAWAGSPPPVTANQALPRSATSTSLPAVGFSPGASSRPPPRSVPDLGGADASVRSQIPKLLSEADVYVKYGLRDKAVKHLQKVLTLDQDNLDARDKYRGLLIKAGKVQEAAEEVIACFRIALGRGDRNLARRYLSDLASVMPLHASLGVLRGELDGTPAVAPVAITISRKQPSAQPAASIEVDGGAGSGEQEVALITGEEGASVPDGFQDLGSEAGQAFDGQDAGFAESGYPQDGLDGGFGAENGSGGPFPAGDAGYDAPDGLGADGMVDGTAAQPGELDGLEAGANPDEELALNTGALNAAMLAARGEEPQLLPEGESGALDPYGTPEADDGGFGADAYQTEPPGVLPPLDGESGGYDPSVAPLPEDLPAEEPASPPPAPVFHEAPPAPPARKPPAPKAAPAPPPPDMAEEFFPDEMAEAEFFIQQGLYDEAKELLATILEDVPDSPKANWMVKRAEALENGEPEPPNPYEPAAEEPAAEEEAPVSQGSSLADELEAELSGVMPAVEGEHPVQISAEEVLAQFKQGVDRAVAQDDADTHHDLGIAYKEMGLLDDAVGEFERSAGGPHKEADAYYLIGLCRTEQGLSQEAATAFQRALEAVQITDSQRVAIHYELGLSLQSLGEARDALRSFHQAMSLEPTFKDVDQRVADLEALIGPLPPEPPPPPRRVPSNGHPVAGGAQPAAQAQGGGAKKGKNIGYI